MRQLDEIQSVHRFNLTGDGAKGGIARTLRVMRLGGVRLFSRRRVTLLGMKRLGYPSGTHAVNGWSTLEIS
jgi:hypothetical protein